MLTQNQQSARAPSATPARGSLLLHLRKVGFGLLLGAVAYFSIGVLPQGLELESTVLVAIMLYACAQYLFAICTLTALATVLLLSEPNATPLTALALVRIGAVVAIFLGLKRWWSEISLIVLVVLGWQLVALLPPLFVPELWADVIPSSLITTAIVELTSVLLLVSFASIPWVSRAKILNSAPIHTFLVHIVLFPVFLLGLLGLVAGVYIHGNSFQAICSHLGVNTRAGAIGGLGVLLAVMLCAALIATIIRSIIRVYGRAAVFVRADKVPTLPFADAAEELKAIAELSLRLARLTKITKELEFVANFKVEEAPTRVARMVKCLAKFENSGCGWLDFSLSGELRAVSDNFYGLVGINKPMNGELRYRDLVDSEALWAQEVADIIKEAVRMKVATRRICSAQNDKTLICEITFSGESNPAAATTERFGSLVVYRTNDSYFFGEHFQAATEFERIGSTAQEEFESLWLMSSQLNNQLAALKLQMGSILSQSKVVSAPEQEAASTLDHALIEINRLQQSLEREQRNSRPSRREGEEIAIGQLINDSLSFINENANISRTRNDNIQLLREPGGILMQAPKTEVFALLKYFTMTMSQIREQLSDVTISCEYEQISAHAAALLPGSAAGRYVRIIIKHQQQFLSPGVLSFQRISPLGSETDAGQGLDLPVRLLSQQTKRMGGFLSLQSSPLKGTQLYIYIPADMSVMGRPSRGDAQKLAKQKDQINEQGQTRVLVVAEQQGSGEHLGGIARSLGCEVVICDPSQLISQLVTPVDFSGRGFDDNQRGSGKQSAYPPVVIDISHFEMLLFAVEKTSYETLALLESIELEIPDKTKLAFVEACDLSKVQLLKTWSVVELPLDDQQVLERISSCVINKESVKEQVLSFDDRDNFSGSGF